jgi:hypothetical protein
VRLFCVNNNNNNNNNNNIFPKDVETWVDPDRDGSQILKFPNIQTGL